MTEIQTVYGVRVTLTSMLTGKANAMHLPTSVGKIKQFLTHRKDCDLVQDMFPELSVDQREFLMTGITPDEWKEMTGGNNTATD